MISPPGSPLISRFDKWSSPLKNSTTKSTFACCSSPVQTLFQDETACSSKESSTLSYEQLSKNYTQDFLNPPFGKSSAQFFAIRDQVLEIEKFLEKHKETIDPKPIRTLIKSLLNLTDFEETMSEMGVILFYLDRDKKIPDTRNFALFRANEISEKVQAYIKQHASVCDNPLIPSGKTHYLLRAFAHMVLTSDQTYNRGGLMAIRALLKYPQFLLSKYLQPEHRDHILSVSKKILKNPAFNTLFQKQIRVHPDLKNAIRLDLKLPPNYPISSVLAFYDCLMGLFSDIRQNDDPNCYAIGSLIYASENHTYKVLSKSVHWLEQGFIAMGESSSIPLAPLLEKRLVYSRDLKVELNSSDALSLAPLEEITQTLQLTTASSASPIPVTIRRTLTTVLEDNNALEKLPYAEKLYYAYKYNSLVHLHLAISELTMMNTLNEGSLNVKEKFIKMCTSLAKINNTEFKTAFETKLMQRLWLENCNEKNIKTVGSTIIVNQHRVENYQGSQRELIRLFKDSLRIFYLKENTYTLIRSITDLQKIIWEILEETKRTYPQNIRISRNKTNIASKNYRIGISNFCSDQIRFEGARKLKNISGKHLNIADVLILSQTGGIEKTVLKHVYQINVSVENITSCSTPYQFLDRLTKKLAAINSGIISTFPKILLATPGKHVWTLAPHSWEILMDHRKEFYRWINSTVFHPAKKRLASRIPNSVSFRIIDRYTPDTKKRKLLKHFFGRRPFSYAKFINTFLENTDLRSIGRAEKIIEEEFSKVNLTTLKLSIILKKLDITIPSKLFHQLYRSLHSFPTQPHCLANDIRLSLINNAIAVVDPYEIELAICKTFYLPLPFHLGDLNWTDAYREDPIHQHLMIKFSWIEGVPQYYTRSGVKEFKEPQKNYRHFSLQYPVVASTPTLY